MALHHRVLAASTSGQSHLIVAMILLSFIVWVTLQGHLGAYLNDLGIGKPPVPAAAPPAAPGSGASSGGGGGGGLIQIGPNAPNRFPFNVWNPFGGIVN